MKKKPGMLVAGIVAAIFLLAYFFRYDLRASTHRAYKLDRWTGQVWMTVGEGPWQLVPKDYFSADLPAGFQLDPPPVERGKRRPVAVP